MKRIYASIIAVLLISTCIISCSKTGTMLYDEILLNEGWTVQSSAHAKQDGRTLSSPGANTDDWYNATVPSTVMGVLTAEGLYKDLMTGTNYKNADRSIFDTAWWYRTTFELPGLTEGKHVKLLFDGLSYRADIWLNGELIASKDSIFGPFCRFSFDITHLAQEKNILAVEVYRAQKADLNIGFVDWNPRPLDENMGLFREVRVITTGAVDMTNTWVKTKVNTETLDEAWLSIETQLNNKSDEEITGNIKGTIEDIEFSVPVKLAANETKKIEILAEDIKKLHIKNPRLWWCNTLGTPELYQMDLKFEVGNKVSASEKVTFGIREVETYITDQGHKGFILNGQKVLIKSAGWTDDIFLRDTPESNEKQVKYVADMNLNSIRFENIWGTSSNIYDLCDRYGLLAIIGWSCQWEWEAYLGTPEDEIYSNIRTQADMDLQVRFMNDQALWLRNHPSIIAWMGGSDKLPRPELEKRFVDLLSQIEDCAYIGAAKTHVSSVSGPTGMKMYGPYEYVGPNYWFIDNKYGGGYGFNTETGVGAQLPVLESIRKFIPEDELWPINKTWDYHCTTSAAALNSLDVLTNVIDNKYGKSNNLKEYLDAANLISYESTKSMFEAFRINKAEGTGIVQWMLNSAWPSLYWQLYDYYLIPTAAYYAVKTANKPIQLIYSYKDNGIYIVNETLAKAEGLKADIKLLSVDSKLLFEKEEQLSAGPNTAVKFTEIDNPAKNAFLSLSLADKDGTVIAENFYALSSQQDAYAWEKTSWVGTPMTAYADFKDIRNIAKADLNISATTDANNYTINIELENKGTNIAFFTELLIKDANGEVLQPVFWSDNYVSILPGEKKTVHCKVDNKSLFENVKKLQVKGWNIGNSEISLK